MHVVSKNNFVCSKLPHKMFNKNQYKMIQQMLISANILQYSFIFSIRKIEKNNFPKISALFFCNYYMPNLLPGFGAHGINKGDKYLEF
jgi:hypothetical protein